MNIALKMKIFWAALIFSLFISSHCLAARQVSLQLPWHHQFQFAGYYMAKEKGYYQQAGLDVDIRDVSHSQNPAEAVAKLKADFGVGNCGVLVEKSLGKPIVAVAAIFQQSPTIFLSLKKSAIRTIDDFAGKKVMLSPGYNSLTLITALHQNGLLDKIEAIDTSFDVQSLINGEADVFNAYSTNEPFLLQTAGIEYRVISPRDYGINFYGDILFTSNELADKQPELVESFRKASIDGWYYALEHPDETIRVITEKYHYGKTVEQLRFEAAEISNIIAPDMIEIGAMGQARWEQIARHLIAAGVISPTFDLNDSFLFNPPQKLNFRKLAPWVAISALVFTTLLTLIALLLKSNHRIKAAKNELAQREQKYSAVMNCQQDALLLHKLTPAGNSRFIEANSAAVKFYGYTRDELLTLSIEDISHPETAENFHSLEKRENRSNLKKVATEAVHIKKNGENVPVEISVSIVALDNEDYVLTVVRDITQRKQAEEQLRLSEEKFRVAFTTSPDSINLTRINDGTYVDVNEGFLRLTGYTREEVVGKSALTLNVWNSHQDRDKLVQTLNEKGYMENLEAEFLAKNGDIIHGLMSAHFLEVGGEKLILTITRDITQRKLAEEKYQTVVSEANAGIALTDAETGEILECNQTLADMVERSREDLIGKSQAILHPQDCRHCDGQTYAFARHKDAPETGPVIQQCITSSGRTFEVEIKAKRIEYAGRKMMLGIFHDISELLNLQKQLRQKYKMEAVGVMAGGIAHNFNNNLSAILGNLEMAKRKIDEPQKTQGFLDKATKASLRARDLVLQILTYSRQDASRRETIDLSLVTEETLDLLQSTLPTSVTLDYQSPPTGTMMIYAEPSRMQEALINLCNNAVQAMDEKGRLEIRLEQVELTQNDIPAQYNCSPGPYIQLAVKDTGCGMDKTILDKIFDPFFTTKSVGKGTGMGLATVQGIVDQHDGMIRVESAPEKGSTFKLFFPFSNQREQTVSSPQAITEIASGKEKILFVDDDAMVAELGKQLLSELGYHVDVMTNSPEALKLFRAASEKFDLVITDQTMPELTGIDLISEIKKIRPNIPTILATGYSSKISAKEAAEMGIDAYCLKPLNLSELSQAVRKVLDLNR